MRGPLTFSGADHPPAPAESQQARTGLIQAALMDMGTDHDADHGAIHDRLRLICIATLRDMGIDPSDTSYLDDLILPLALFIRARARARTGAYLVGIGGGPGAGKTTMSRLLARCLQEIDRPAATCLSLSIDDFYRAREDRLRMGYKWRTLPGTHDTDRIAAFLSALDDSGATIAVPRYDLGRDEPLPDEPLIARPAICLFDGAMVGSTLPGYEVLARRLDFFIYLDVPTPLLRRWRFDRERKLRQRSGGKSGFPLRRMQEFWREALGPSIDKWVRPNAQTADLVLKFDAVRAVTAAYSPKTIRIFPDGVEK